MTLGYEYDFEEVDLVFVYDLEFVFFVFLVNVYPELKKLLPDKLPLQTPQVPPDPQCPHLEQLEPAEQLAEPVHLPSCP